VHFNGGGIMSLREERKETKGDNIEEDEK